MAHAPSITGSTGGGGSAYDVTPPAATTQAKAAGASLTAHTFGAFGGADAGSIDGYTARIVNATGSTSWSGSGLGAWTPSADADGDAGVLALDATIGGVVVATALHDYSRADPAGAGGTLTELLALDFPAIFTASGAYNFLTTGGTGGSGGDGPHTHGGVAYELSGSATVTQLEITANGLEMQQATGGAFQLGVNLRDTTPAIDPAGPCHALTRVASAVSGEATGGVQVGIQRATSLGSWTTGDAVTRYRRADATPDLYAVAYNGSTFDALAGSTVTANDDVRLQVGTTSLFGTVCRGDTGTATDPADWDALPEFAKAEYASTLASFTGTYPAGADCWVFVGGGLDCDGIFKTLTAYGLEA